MTAWHNNPDLKASTLERLHEHQRLDQIIQGTYWEDGRGCHLGCLTHCEGDAHDATVREFGIPLKVTYWLESIFENLPADKCAQWVIDSTEAISPGADLSLCHHELAVWLLGPESPSATGNMHELAATAVTGVRELHTRAANGELVAEEEWSAAESAAWSAAESAARSAARSVRSAAWSDWSAWSAAESVRSAAESVRSAAWEAIAAKSLEIFRNAPCLVS